MGLYIGIHGVELLKDFGDERYGFLRDGIVIESLFHHLVPTEVKFRSAWVKELDGAQILVGYWKVDRDGKWVRDSRMIVVPEFYQPQSVMRDMR